MKTCEVGLTYMKTLAAVLYEINRPLKIEELSIPALKSGQVLVRMAYSGICRTQLNEIRGLKGKDRFLPHTLGHEGSGVVESIGPGVRKVVPGDHVILTWIKGEGLEVSSTIYTGKNGSKVNSGAVSTFMTRAVVSENRLVKIPEDLPLHDSALFGCSLPTGMGVIFNTLRVRKENEILVMGLGGVGISAVIGAKIVGCRKIMAVDISEKKLEFAKKVGATDVFNARKQDIHSAVMKVSDNKGIDFVIEAAGLKETIEMGLDLIHDKGTVVIAGNIAAGQRIEIDPFELIKGKKIIGTWGGETRPDIDIPFYMESIAKVGFDPNCLITTRFRLEDINYAFYQLERGKMIKGLIDFSENVS